MNPLRLRDPPSNTGPEDSSQTHGLGIAVPCAIIAIILCTVPCFILIRRRHQQRQRLRYRVVEEGDWYPQPCPLREGVGKQEEDEEVARSGELFVLTEVNILKYE
ncbi:hypothetical protein BDD12DRAFT_880027 [Trichophaea hybrida]|nr:hypothetical protein BDD12DRAFT_880027 [Trichophaea hybrida]